MPYKAGEKVRVPSPIKREGMVRATMITPASVSPEPRFAWVRIEEGDCKGENERVPYEQIEYDDLSGVGAG